MPHPFQCLATIKVEVASGKDLLLAACGPKLLSTSAKDGSLLSQWTSGSAGLVEVESGDKDHLENGERPAKKQKTTEKAPSTLSNVIKLAVSPDQRHVITVTEDKCIRVFDIDPNGVLTELSQRIMPKRPCAIEVLPDNETIICGDKFGDVYSLPLLPVDMPAKDAEAVAALKQAPESVKPAFKPSATNLTVHSQRNLKALEAQQKQKLFAPRKEALAFEHKLLLGHVSMLTDVAFATREVEGKQRGYILSADRDEHIRVSRGPPQAHIIEGYCLAHKEFISKLCLVPGTDLLISGGGDPFISVWDWPSFALKQTINLERFFPERLKTHQPATRTSIAISGIWSVPVHSDKAQAIVIACERYRSLVIFSSSPHGVQISSATSVELPAAPVAVSFLDGHLVVSMDVRGEDQHRLAAFQITKETTDTVLVSPDSMFEQTTLVELNKLTGIEEDSKAIDSLLYNVENLRKRTGPGDEEPEQD